MIWIAGVCFLVSIVVVWVFRHSIHRQTAALVTGIVAGILFFSNLGGGVIVIGVLSGGVRAGLEFDPILYALIPTILAPFLALASFALLSTWRARLGLVALLVVPVGLIYLIAVLISRSI